MGQHRPHRWSPFFIEIQRQGKILSPMRLCSGKMWKSNVKNIFSYNFPRWPVGVKSYRVVLKLLRNHLRQRPQTRNTSNGNPIHVWLSILYNYGSYGKKKKNLSQQKLRHLPENDYSYLDTMTGTNSSNDRLILRRNVEINSNWYFSYDVFSGMKSSTTWNGNAIAQSPRKMSEFRDISNTSDIRFLMVYRTIIDVILHLFIICNDLWCQLPFFHKLSVITEALFSVRCLRCVVVARM